MSKRSNWCEFSEKERQIIYIRDNYRCVYCGGTFGLGVAHIFVSRANGGKGCKENGVLMCAICHTELDNGKDEIKRDKIQIYSENYLKKLYGEIDQKSFIYSKWTNFNY